MKYYHCFRGPIWNRLANSKPILNENRPIHLIDLSLEKNPFPLRPYSHILVKKPAELPPPSLRGTSEIRDPLC